MIEPAWPEHTLAGNIPLPTQEEQEFEVEQILARKGQQYLVKWKGYPDSENTWEPLKNLAELPASSVTVLAGVGLNSSACRRGLCQWLIKSNPCHLTLSLSPSTEASASHRPRCPPTPFSLPRQTSLHCGKLFKECCHVFPCQRLHPHRGCPGTCSEIPRTQRHKTFCAECTQHISTYLIFSLTSGSTDDHERTQKSQGVLWNKTLIVDLSSKLGFG